MKLTTVILFLLIATGAYSQAMYRDTCQAGDSTGVFSNNEKREFVTITIKDVHSTATADTFRIYRIIPYSTFKDTVPMTAMNLKTGNIDSLLIVPGGSYGYWFAYLMYPETIMYARTNTIIANKAIIIIQGKDK